MTAHPFAHAWRHDQRVRACLVFVALASGCASRSSATLPATADVTVADSGESADEVDAEPVVPDSVPADVDPKAASTPCAFTFTHDVTGATPGTSVTAAAKTIGCPDGCAHRWHVYQPDGKEEFLWTHNDLPVFACLVFVLGRHRVCHEATGPSRLPVCTTACAAVDVHAPAHWYAAVTWTPQDVSPTAFETYGQRIRMALRPRGWLATLPVTPDDTCLAVPATDTTDLEPFGPGGNVGQLGGCSLSSWWNGVSGWVGGPQGAAISCPTPTPGVVTVDVAYVGGIDLGGANCVLEVYRDGSLFWSGTTTLQAGGVWHPGGFDLANDLWMPCPTP